MNRFPLRAVAATAVALMLVSGCARQINPGVHKGSTVGEAVRTYQGVVEAARVIQVQEGDMLEQNGMGQVLGGVIGGLAGSEIGGGKGRAIAIGAGALLGAAAGALAEQELKKQNGMEYIVKLSTGELMTIVQGLEPQIAPGTPVYVQMSDRGRARVVAAR